MSAEDDAGVPHVLLGRPNKFDAPVFVGISHVLGGGVPRQLEVTPVFHMFCWASPTKLVPQLLWGCHSFWVVECRVS